ncbi:amino acid adenylation domain-containing protein [Streptomyces sp. NPDC050560]|uniref:amino acid adenylation domain-containing protein n=1 Tax=Streptomyces sp. NPDC050560 TaxID=3365630 RepID=UPI00379876EE
MESGSATLTHEVFAGWVGVCPGAVAVVGGGCSLSYGEVDVWAGRLAGVLRGCGVGPEVVVGVCVPRSVVWPVVVLAVLRAGGVFVPLDPEYPGERLEFMVRDCGAAVVVGSGGVAEQVAGACGVPLVAPEVSDEGDGVGVVGDVGLVPGNLAYVIYTSGSTGRPKGVQITHGSLSNLLTAMGPALEAGPGRTTLQCVSFGFDISVADTLTTLTHGGTLAIAAKEEVASPDLLSSRLLADRVHTVVLPPSVLATVDGRTFPDLRVVISGGEACPPKLAASFAARFRFLNGYGPTETAVAASLFEVPPGFGERAAVPIGTAVDGASLYVVDGAGAPAAPGATGEICVGGTGVARGYLRRPGLTAAAFVADPFSGVPGARMYRTGDLGALLPDGTLEFRGRADHQVKIRGHRVELDEIEKTLERHPWVGQAAVVVTESGFVGPQLRAFVVPARTGAAAPPAPTGAELRRHLAAELPDYMLPNSTTPLAEFPLTANHKIDRAALAARGAAARRRGAAPVAPRTPLESDLVRMWREALEEPEIGVRDDFFELGGHSLLAAQLVARIEKSHGVRLSLETLLAHGRTVEDLARAVAGAAPERAAPRRPITRIRRPGR